MSILSYIKNYKEQKYKNKQDDLLYRTDYSAWEVKHYEQNKNLDTILLEAELCLKAYEDGSQQALNELKLMTNGKTQLLRIIGRNCLQNRFNL